MIKLVNGWEILQKLLGNCKVYVKHFSRVKTKCMKNFIKSSQRKNLYHYILYVGTNDICLDRSPELIAKSIIDIALTLKTSHTMSAFRTEDSDSEECISNLILKGQK